MTVEDCESISDVSARLNCLNNSMYGDVEEGATIGAVAGSALGAGIGYLEGGPRGALIGAVSGVAVGGLTGGAAAYFQYNEQRSAGDAARMAENAEADLEAENRQQEELLETYQEYISQMQQKISQLQAQATVVSQDQKPNLLAKAKQVAGDINQQSDVISKTLPKAQQFNSNFHQYALGTANSPQDSSSAQGSSSQQETISPQEFAPGIQENDQNVAALQAISTQLQGLNTSASNTVLVLSTSSSAP